MTKKLRMFREYLFDEVEPGLCRYQREDITNAFEDVVGSCNKCKRYGYIECPVYSTECTDSDFPYGDWYCASFEPQTTA